MVPFIVPNLYNRLSKLPVKNLESDANYYDWLEDIWLHVEPAYEAFYAWAGQRCRGDVTDLGCGNGNAGQKLNAKYYYDYVQSFPEVKFLDLNAEIGSLPKLEGDTFILSHVLEHLNEPKRSLAALSHTMKSGDRLIICVPDGGIMESTAIPFNQYIPSNDATAKHLHHVYAWTAADLYNTLIRGNWDGIDMATANVCGFACIWAMAIKK